MDGQRKRRRRRRRRRRRKQEEEAEVHGRKRGRNEEEDEEEDEEEKIPRAVVKELLENSIELLDIDLVDAGGFAFSVKQLSAGLC